MSTEIVLSPVMLKLVQSVASEAAYQGLRLYGFRVPASHWPDVAAKTVYIATVGGVAHGTLSDNCCFSFEVGP